MLGCHTTKPRLRTGPHAPRALVHHHELCAYAPPTQPDSYNMDFTLVATGTTFPLVFTIQQAGSQTTCIQLCVPALCRMGSCGQLRTTVLGHRLGFLCGGLQS